MKPLLTILTLVFTVMFSSTSYAEWSEVGESMSGNTFYVDFERIRKHDGYVYWWELNDLSKPDEDGDLSYKYYTQGECKLFRYKTLTVSYHKQSMGKGSGSQKTYENPQWEYPSPNSVVEFVLTKVCSR